MTTDYNSGKIYAVRSYIHPEDVYYGSTINSLSVRMRQHKADKTGNEMNRRSFRTSAIVVAHGDAYIELVEEYPCSSKEELEKREGWYHRNKPCVNMKVAGRTDAEYREDNRESIKEKWHENKEAVNAERRESYAGNPEKIRERNAKNYAKNGAKYCVAANKKYQENKNELCKIERERYAEDEEFRNRKIAASKKRSELKVDEIADYQKSYYEKNKEHLKAQQKVARDKNKDKWNQTRRDKAAIEKGMSLDDMIRCPNCPARFPAKSGLAKHVKKCEPSENGELRNAVIAAFEKFNIGPINHISTTEIEVPFKPTPGIIRLGTIVLITSTQPTICIQDSELAKVETIIEEFVLEYDET